jgi:putative tricarboxylic transport membrane protein
MAERTGQLLVSCALLALGAALGVGTYLLPEAAGYAQVGPRLFPGLVAAGLVLVGALLAKDAFTSGFRHPPDDPRGAFDGRAFAWISSGLILHMLLISGIGFVLASTLLFAATARGFGSRRIGRDLAIGVLAATVIYLIFTRGLTLQLPWGAWLPEP